MFPFSSQSKWLSNSSMCNVSERLVSDSSELVLLRASVLEETDDLRERLKVDIIQDNRKNKKYLFTRDKESLLIRIYQSITYV